MTPEKPTSERVSARLLDKFIGQLPEIKLSAGSALIRIRGGNNGHATWCNRAGAGDNSLVSYMGWEIYLIGSDS